MSTIVEVLRSRVYGRIGVRDLGGRLRVCNTSCTLGTVGTVQDRLKEWVSSVSYILPTRYGDVKPQQPKGRRVLPCLRIQMRMGS